MKNRKKGETSFIVIMIVMILMVVLAFGFDFVNVIRRRHNFNRQINYIARTVARQGGLQSSERNDWVENRNFVTSSELYNQTSEVFSRNNIPDDEWDVTIGTSPTGSSSLNSSSELLLDFGDDIYVTGTIKSKWIWTPQVLKGFDGQREYTYKRKVASETWTRTDPNEDWINNK